MRGSRLSLLLFCLAAFSACASSSVTMVDPQSGATARCGAAGVGIMAAGAGGFVEGCMKQYEGRGYVAEDKLTPEQRADLEKRGILPKPEPPPTIQYSH